MRLAAEGERNLAGNTHPAAELVGSAARAADLVQTNIEAGDLGDPWLARVEL